MGNKGLKNKTVLITRPKDQGKSLKKSIEQLGGNVISFPTLVIKPLTENNLESLTAQVDSSDILLFLSANAVKHAPALKNKVYQKIIAIGPGTAAALSQRGFHVDAIPENFSSEGLLALPLLTKIAGKRIAIFCGKNTRSYLKNELIKRGAQVFLITVYQREKPTVNEKTIEALTHQKLDAIVSTSTESLQNLCTLFILHQAWLQHIPLIVISERMQVMAKQNELNLVFMADNATETAIIKTLQQIHLR